MIRTVGCALAILLLASFPLWAKARDLSGMWESHVFGSRVVVRLKQDGNSIGGVAYVYNAFGKKSTYHFQGVVQGNHVQAEHHSGHSFVGAVRDSRSVSGVLTTRRGYRIPVNASRR